MPTQEQIRQQINDDNALAHQFQAQEFDMAGGYNDVNGAVKFTAAEQRKHDIVKSYYKEADVIGRYSQYLRNRDNATRNTINDILVQDASRAGRPVEEEVALQRAFLNSFEEQKNRRADARASTPPRPPVVTRASRSYSFDADDTRFCCYFLFHPLDSRSKVQE
ncbi:MAG: hypothetical protein MK137_06110 [Rickettsiales bacterium]|nr:hypothetical protein [Rickettsiales bacterium]